MKRPKTLIRDFLNRVLYGHTPCTHVSLHLGSSKSDPLLRRQTSEHNVTSDEFKGSALDTFINDIIEFINEGDVDDDEDETYCLLAHWENGEQEDITSRPIKPKNSNGNQGALLNQSWRHIEACMRINASMAESVAKHANVQMHSATRMVEEYGDVHIRLAEAEQKNLDRTHERLLEAKKDERQAEFMSAAMQGILSCLPMFAGKLAGILPMGADAFKASPQYQSLKAMFEETTPEQWPYVEQWLGQFPGSPAQKAALKMAIDSIMNDMFEAEKAKSNGNGQAVKEPAIGH